jgi:N-acetylneuraminic acid mutarotase
MKKKFVLCVAALLAHVPTIWPQEVAPLPSPVTNNAVAAIRVSGTTLVYSFSGLGQEMKWNSVTNSSYALNLKYNKWTTVRSAPGSGRLGAVAASAQGQVFLIGGFVPDQSGLEAVLPDLAVYDPIGLRWYRGPDLPVPVRDAVTGVYHDRYVYVIGGLSPQGTSNAVQIYDVVDQHWIHAPPFPGSPVFGHAGAVVGDVIIYVDGAKKNSAGKPAFVISDECWIGKIDKHDPKKIQWSKLPPHPGRAGYRMAGGGSDRDLKAYFAGGSEAIYDFKGISLDGKPAEPLAQSFAYNLRSNTWETISEKVANPTMDHRGLTATPDGLLLVGGMASGPKVIADTKLLPKASAAQK